jgi:hypothetical protein
MNIYGVYLRIILALALGLVGHVYRMTERWGARVPEKKQAAAAQATGVLITRFGYPRCPSCEWATKVDNEHLAPGTWCYDQEFYRRHGKYPDDEVDGVPAHNLFPQIAQ